MNQPGVQPSKFHIQTQPQQQAQQAAQQQRAGSNSPLMMSHGGGIANASNVQSQQMGQVASYFTVNPNNVQIGTPSDQAKAAMAYELFKRILKGEATAPTEKLRELGALYEYLKKYMDQDDDENLGEEFEGLYDILDWFRRSRAYYGGY